jgi:hypothetical protein
MHAIPERFDQKMIDPSGCYVCPLCQAQSTSDESDTGWVYCPMLRDRPVCLGCCIDYQSVARADEFDSHPYRDLFDSLSAQGGMTVERLRQICLNHQVTIVRGQLNSAHNKTSADELEGLLSAIEAAQIND